jgi:hypothetical protein
MKPIRLALGASLALALSAAQPLAAPPKKAPAPAPAPVADIEPEALQALQRMSAYLGTLSAFEIKSVVTIDLVMEDGQKVEIDGANRYVVRRPNGFVIETSTDRKVRQFIYDGKQLTLYAPKLGYYATVPAPPTIRQTLDAAYDRYGISLPLEDLFRWSEPNADARSSLLRSAWVVGPATIDGVDTDQYAFREGDIDWQIWIQRGDRPLPRKVVIVDRLDDAHPQFTARLDWNTRPQLAANTFTFQPGNDAKAIRMAATR